jgi:hypothetical protein
MRYVLEGEWSGYTSSQRRVVHREVISSEKRAERLKKLAGIRYTDGTTLMMFLRVAKPRERVQEVHSYTSLIRKAEADGGTFYQVA